MANVKFYSAAPTYWGAVILDPAAGKGDILDVVRDWESPLGVSYRTKGMEIHQGRALIAQGRDHDVQCLDALWHSWPACGVVISNPPYNLAYEFVTRALEQAPDVDKAFLLPIGFMGSIQRASLHRMHPSDVYVLPRRPDFMGEGTTDNEASCWFVWGPGRGGRWKVLELEDE